MHICCCLLLIYSSQKAVIPHSLAVVSLPFRTYTYVILVF